MRAFIAIALLLMGTLAKADCLKDGQSVVLEGLVSRETFPGRPNYTSIDDGDEPETVWILTARTPNCVTAESMEDGSTMQIGAAIKRFQLVFESGVGYEKYKGLPEHQAKVEGQLFVGHTGHHHTKALISITRINGR